MAEVAVQQSTGLFADHREEECLLHDAAAQDDFLRREGAHGVRAELRQVFALQRPGRVLRRELVSGNAPAFLDRRPGGHALQARSVVGAVSFRHRVIRTDQDFYVPDFRMDQPVHRLAVDDQAAANAGADRHIETTVEPPRSAEPCFRQCRSVDVRVKADGHLQRLPERREQRIIAPGQLRRGGDIAKGRGSGVEIERAERPDAQRGEGKAPEIFRHPRHRFRRGQGRIHRTIRQCAVFVKDRQHHLGAASFQSAVIPHRKTSLRDGQDKGKLAALSQLAF